MNNPVIWQAGIGVLTLFFFFLMYKFTKTWRWFHVTMMFFVYAASIATIVYMSLTLKTHNAWRTLVREQQALIAELSAERDMLMIGDISKREQETTPVRELHAQLGRSILDRGRVWRGCTLANRAADGTVTIDTSGPATAPRARNNIQAEMILYAFTEAPAPAELAPVLLNPASAINLPRYFIGEYTVTAATDTSVTMRPTLPLQDESNAAIATGSPWCLYETMAADGHVFFVTDPQKSVNLSLPADEEPVFGTSDENRIQMHMTLAGTLLVQPRNPREVEIFQRYQANMQSVIIEYTRDGKRASDQDPPENRWLKVRFTGPHEVEVDSASKLGAVVTSEDFFDRGRAEIPILQRNEPAKFKKDDIGIFPPSDEVNLLISSGVCELIEPVYVRSLHNYAPTFYELHQRAQDLDDDIVRVTKSTAELTNANKSTVSQIAYREAEQTKLEQDLAKFVYERDQIEKYKETLTAAVTAKRNNMSYLYRANHKLATDLAAAHRALKAEIDEQTAAAAAAP